MTWFGSALQGVSDRAGEKNQGGLKEYDQNEISGLSSRKRAIYDIANGWS